MILSSVIGIHVLVSSVAGASADQLAYLSLTDGYWQVWVMTEEGQNRKQVTRSEGDKTRISWFPDQKRLLVNTLEGTAHIVDLENGSDTTIPLKLTGFEDAVVSPDGKRIAFSMSTSGSVDDHNIWVSDIGGSNMRKMTSLPWLQHWPTWSAEGKEIYFVSGNGQQSHDIWTVDLLNGETRQITANQLYHFDVAIAPTGEIAYSSNRSGNYEIWITPAKGEDFKVTDDPALDAKPSWSPDGNTLAYESSTGGSLAIWRVDLKSGVSTRLTPTDTPSRFPVWQGKGGAK